MKQAYLFFFFFAISLSVHAQMYNGVDSLYGNEWIDYSATYYKIPVAKNGIVRMSFADLQAAGALTGNPRGDRFRLFRMGQEVPIFVTTDGVLSSGDFIEFWGEKNDGSLDRFLYPTPEDVANPKYSLFNDAIFYYLTVSATASTQRYTTLNNNLTNLPVPMLAVENTAVTVLSNGYWGGRFAGGSYGSHKTAYDVGEGFLGTRNTATFNVALPAPAIVTNAGDAALAVRYVLGNYGDNSAEIKLNNNAVRVDNNTASSIISWEEAVPISFVTGNNTVSFTNLGTSDDEIRVAHVQLKYPMGTTFGGDTLRAFSLAPSAGVRYLEVSGVPTGSAAPVFYNLTTKTRIESTLDNGVAKVAIPGFTTTQELVMVRGGNTRPSALSAKNFTQWPSSSEPVNYLIVSHPQIMGSGAQNYVQQYADYRASAAGGSYVPLVASIHELYEQFSYGVFNHEIAIRNFSHYAMKRWPAEYLFLIGKGAAADRRRAANSAFAIYDFVPSFGYPQSDIQLVSDNHSNLGKLAVGRYAAKSPLEVRYYLDKMRTYEQQRNNPQTINDRAWMKKVLQLGGGDEAIQTSIQGHITQLSDILVNSNMAADVFNFYKTSTNPVQTADSEQIRNLVSSGINMLTFFGHSAPQTLDFDIGSPTDYNFNGRYPFIYTIGCHTSRMFENPTTISEKFMVVENQGAIGFIGATFVTQLNNLAEYSRVFYRLLGSDMYGASVGKIMQRTTRELPGTSYSSELLKEITLLHGDPALVLYPTNGPDLVFDPATTSIKDASISPQIDSISLQVGILNLGNNTRNDTLQIAFQLQQPDGSMVALDTVISKSANFRSVQDIKVGLPDTRKVGFNKLILTLDALNQIDEVPAPPAELNNKIEFPFLVIDNNAVPIAPSNYGIVAKHPFTLVASTANTLAAETYYYFQADTSKYFNSPLFTQGIQKTIGGALKWQPNLPAFDGKVYYWRVSVDSTQTNGQGFQWNHHSFMYKPDQVQPGGWNQSHYFQMKEDSLNFLTLNEPNRKLTYVRTASSLKLTSGAWSVYPVEETASYLDGVLQNFYWFTPSGMVAVVMDSLAFEAWENPSQGGDVGLYGSTYMTIQSPHYWFPFRTTTETGRNDYMNFIENIVPDGHYVLTFSTQFDNSNTYRPDLWAVDSVNIGRNIFQVLESQGASRIRETIQSTNPYMFFFQKGNPNFAGKAERLQSNLTELLTWETQVYKPWYTGYVKSDLIGPSTAWSSLEYNVSEFTPSEETVTVQVYGTNAVGQDSMLLETTAAGTIDLSFISADTYPYLYLKCTTLDLVKRTSPQLDYWRVQYQPLPEAALAPNLVYTLNNDTLQQGQMLDLTFKIDNIGQLDMDSMLVKYVFRDNQNREATTIKRYQALPQGENMAVQLQYETKDLLGPQSLFIEVNPDKDQPEQYHFNNVMVQPLMVVGDERNPIMDILFDGQRILDNDIVSARPEIVISLKDENAYLTLDDTSIFRLTLKHPDDTEERLFFSNPSITFVAASGTGANNKARVEWRPNFTVDGTYSLQVSSSDVSGNRANTKASVTRFQVITKEMVSNLLNYPNPFTTSTQFVFTLTGAQVPDDIRIQIMTVNGTIVREVFKEELGSLRVGVNRTDFRWDGTDTFGDRLANGVYLYRVVMKKQDGSDYELYETGADVYFQGGFGKMVLLR